MDEVTQATFDKLLAVKGNNQCIDCDAPNPKWASVNNGCFICMVCAGNHRSMGVHISFVRSINMDSWTKQQLKRMEYGGNAKLKQFWKDQKFPSSLTAIQRLDNTAMDKYRDSLLQRAKDGASTPKDIEFIGYQKRVIQKRSPNANRSMQGFGNTDYTPQSNHGVLTLSNLLYGSIAICIAAYVYHVSTK
mmetsp:Transcript_9037/g.14753  ORF Transcript_9037/g.14753 Transcript_9037/m.14753 type:complete len:190 (-) Transcript_9037:55-624(-)|eukprot:CAMPEP_0197033568 /NCGR_PEP_ID=MMETSP1384-20130603/11947_1 /TAXON_ID=29189 /ORGANISM="Ammonia sp." /LENGTH=189 /DNA_ID=CAMNT_0042463397 /DNA_START=27 /DNA_END=596 /DNA_ORIENTATION=-